MYSPKTKIYIYIFNENVINIGNNNFKLKMMDGSFNMKNNTYCNNLMDIIIYEKTEYCILHLVYRKYYVMTYNWN